MSTVSLIAPQSLLWTEGQGLGRKPVVRVAVDASSELGGGCTVLGLAPVFLNLTQARVTWEEEPLSRAPPSQACGPFPCSIIGMGGSSPHLAGPDLINLNWVSNQVQQDMQGNPGSSMPLWPQPQRPPQVPVWSF